MRFKKVKKRRLSQRRLAELVLLGELLCFVCLFAIFNTSWNHIVNRRIEAVNYSIAASDESGLVDAAEESYRKTEESVYEVVDETVWATESVNFRTGPNTDYESAGTLNTYTGIQRTGLTFNDWSQVQINGEDYYVSSSYLTTEPPLITDGGAKGEYEKYALSLFPNYGWADTEITSLISLWNHESGWNPNAHNRSSGAHGIPQALPASKMSSEGSDYYTNGNTQIRWGLNYIKNRYGSPSNAWGHFRSAGWY